MKKLLVIIIFLSIVNLIILLRVNDKIDFVVDDFAVTNKCDTIINKVRIDSIEYFIKSKNSIINKIKYDTKENSKKIDALDDDANVKLFKELVSN